MDQGRNFESRMFKEICGLLGIEKTRTTAYRPQSDGFVERASRTIEVCSYSSHQGIRKIWIIGSPYY